ncbi:MAG: sugar phosphate isomerase/epimerase family protein [Candidatus Bathyarchaeota archaeon]
MELAASTLHLLDRPLEDILAQLVTLDVKKIELADSGNHSLNPKRVERLQEFKSSYNIEFSIHAPYSDTNLSADDDLIREWVLKRIRASIRFASELDAKCLILHPGWTTATEPFMRGRSWELNIRSLRWLQRYAGDYGVEVLLENVPNPTPYLLVSLDDFRLFDAEMTPRMDYVLDIGHSNLLGETLGFIEEFSTKIKHVHVSDNEGETDSHLPIGEGTIDWEETMGALKRIGFKGWVVIESYSKIGESIDYLRRLL